MFPVFPPLGPLRLIPSHPGPCSRLWVGAMPRAPAEVQRCPQEQSNLLRAFHRPARDLRIFAFGAAVARPVCAEGKEATATFAWWPRGSSLPGAGICIPGPALLPRVPAASPPARSQRNTSLWLFPPQPRPNAPDPEDVINTCDSALCF